MRPCPQLSIAAPRQLSLLPVLTGPGRLTPDERQEAVAVLATLLIEAARPARRETADDNE